MFRLKWIDLDPDLHHAGKYKCIQGSHAQPHAYTLPDLAYKKVCVCEKRIFFVHGADTDTQIPNRSSAG